MIDLVDLGKSYNLTWDYICGGGPAFGGASPAVGRGRAWPGPIWWPSSKRIGEAVMREGNGPALGGLHREEKEGEKRKEAVATYEISTCILYLHVRHV